MRKIGFLLLLLLFCCSVVQAQSLSSAPDEELTGLNAPDTSIAALHDGKPLYLNFWASWCPPCVREMPHIDALYRQYGDQINFAAVTIDDNADDAQTFLTKTGLTVPVYTGDLQRLAADYGLSAIPVSVLIAADGTVLAQTMGGMDAAALEAFLAPAL
jgi:cytochrome c biogenesis protein CcmG, thiol:disulfide interchange protein DsbE